MEVNYLRIKLSDQEKKDIKNGYKDCWRKQKCIIRKLRKITNKTFRDQVRSQPKKRKTSWNQHIEKIEDRTMRIARNQLSKDNNMPNNFL